MSALRIEVSTCDNVCFHVGFAGAGDDELGGFTRAEAMLIKNMAQSVVDGKFDWAKWRIFYDTLERYKSISLSDVMKFINVAREKAGQPISP